MDRSFALSVFQTGCEEGGLQQSLVEVWKPFQPSTGGRSGHLPMSRNSTPSRTRLRTMSRSWQWRAPCSRDWPVLTHHETVLNSPKVPDESQWDHSEFAANSTGYPGAD